MNRSKSPFGALLAKQLREDFNVGRKRKFDFFGMLVNLIITAAIVALVVLVFDHFIVMYLGVEVEHVADLAARQHEALTFVYSVVLLAGVVGAMGQICYGLFENEDLRIYVSLPLSPDAIVVSKMVSVYLRQIVTSAVILLPFSVMTGVAGDSGAMFYVMTGVSCLLVPFVTVSIATLLALPFYYLKKFIRSRFILNFVVTTLLLAVLFVGYSFILRLLEQILAAGEIKYMFTTDLMTKLATAARWLVPGNCFAALCLGQDTVKSLLVILAFLVFGTAVAILVVRALYAFVSSSRLSGRSGRRYAGGRKAHSIFGALLAKEFNEVFRSHDYSYQYFSVAVLMPLMVCLCMRIGSSLTMQMLFVNVNFELSVFVVAIFGVLTNTFCATNVSRDGQLFLSVKAMPVSAHQVIYSKIVFCMVVSFASELLAAAGLYLFGFVSWWQALVVLGVGALLAFAQICFATRLDFSNPNFSSDDDVEIRESNSTISAVLFAGLIAVAALGLGIVYFALYKGLLQSAANPVVVTSLCSVGFAVLCAVLSVWYLNRGLKKSYALFTGDKK